MGNWLEKKISMYWVVVSILIIAIILVATWRGGDSQVLVNQISFAVGIASIFLAIVAMIYSFIQAEQSSRQNTTVQSALEKIVDKIEEFANLKSDIELIRKDSSDILSHIQGQLSNNMDTVINSGISEETKEELEKLKQNMMLEIEVLKSQKVQQVSTHRGELNKDNKYIFDSIKMYVNSLPEGSEFTSGAVYVHLLSVGVEVINPNQVAESLELCVLLGVLTKGIENGRLVYRKHDASVFAS